MSDTIEQLKIEIAGLKRENEILRGVWEEVYRKGLSKNQWGSIALLAQNVLAKATAAKEGLIK